MSRTPTRAPRSVLVVAVLGIAFLALPVVGLLQRAPWSSLDDLLGRRSVLDALRVSLTVSAMAAAIVVVLGTPLAWMLARVETPYRLSNRTGHRLGGRQEESSPRWIDPPQQRWPRLARAVNRRPWLQPTRRARTVSEIGGARIVVLASWIPF